MKSFYKLKKKNPNRIWAKDMDLSLNIKYKWLWNIWKYIQLHLELQIKSIPFPIY